VGVRNGGKLFFEFLNHFVILINEGAFLSGGVGKKRIVKTEWYPPHTFLRLCPEPSGSGHGILPA